MTSREWRVGFHAALRRATRPAPTRPAPTPAPSRPDWGRVLGGVLAAEWVRHYTPRPAPGPIDYTRPIRLEPDDEAPAHRDPFPGPVRALAARCPVVAGHLQAFAHGCYRTAADALAAIVIHLSELNSRYTAAELRRAQASPVARLMLTAEECAAIRTAQPTTPARGWGECAR